MDALNSFCLMIIGKPKESLTISTQGFEDLCQLEEDETTNFTRWASFKFPQHYFTNGNGKKLKTLSSNELEFEDEIFIERNSK